MLGPTGFTFGHVCGQGAIDLPQLRTHFRLEIVLFGVGECEWSDEEDPLAGTVTGVPTAGRVVAKFS